MCDSKQTDRTVSCPTAVSNTKAVTWAIITAALTIIMETGYFIIFFISNHFTFNCKPMQSKSVHLFTKSPTIWQPNKEQLNFTIENHFTSLSDTTVVRPENNCKALYLFTSNTELLEFLNVFRCKATVLFNVVESSSGITGTSPWEQQL